MRNNNSQNRNGAIGRAEAKSQICRQPGGSDAGLGDPAVGRFRRGLRCVAGVLLVALLGVRAAQQPATSAPAVALEGDLAATTLDHGYRADVLDDIIDIIEEIIGGGGGDGGEDDPPKAP